MISMVGYDIGIFPILLNAFYYKMKDNHDNFECFLLQNQG
jgi:hypothetical protein